MNADRTTGVAADLSAGARLPDLVWWGVGLLGAGAVLLLIGSVLLVSGARSHPRRSDHDPAP